MSGRVGAGVGVFVLRDGKVLLGKRHSDQQKAASALHGEGTWTMPGGKLEFGESFEHAAARELLEETGMRAVSADVLCVSNDKVADAHFVTIGLLCAAEGEPQVMEPEVITEWRWFDINQLPAPLFFPSAEIIEKYKAQRFY